MNIVVGDKAVLVLWEGHFIVWWSSCQRCFCVVEVVQMLEKCGVWKFRSHDDGITLMPTSLNVPGKTVHLTWLLRSVTYWWLGYFLLRGSISLSFFLCYILRKLQSVSFHLDTYTKRNHKLPGRVTTSTLLKEFESWPRTYERSPSLHKRRRGSLKTGEILGVKV